MPLLDTMKKHPYVVGGAALVGLFVLYALLKSGSSQQQAQSPESQLAAYNLQEQQLQAAMAQNANQYNAQIAQTQLQANAATNQTNAALQSQYNQDDAAVIAAAIQAQANNTTIGAEATTQQQLQSLEAGVSNHQISAELAAAENTNNDTLTAYQGQLGYATNLNNLQAQIASQGITSTTQLASQQLQNQYNINNQVVGLVGKAGLNHGTSSLEQQLTAILSGAMNQSNIGVAAENTNALSAVSANQAQGQLWNALGNVGSSLAKALFA